MGDFFTDKTYQNLDWISQAVEPWEWDLIPTFAAFPERTEITTELLEKAANKNTNSYNKFLSSLSIESTIRLIAETQGSPLCNLQNFTDSMQEMLTTLFKFEVEPDTQLDGSTLKFTAPVYFVKTKPIIDETICNTILIKTVSTRLYYSLNLRNTDAAHRAAEIVDLINSHKLARSLQSKRSQLVTELQSVFVDDLWRIRNMALGLKLIEWAIDYIENGNLVSMANFAKTKVMTHSNKPIYSIQEVE